MKFYECAVLGSYRFLVNFLSFSAQNWLTWFQAWQEEDNLWCGTTNAIIADI